jgi:hypothetical protein
VTSVLGCNLLSGHFSGNSLAKQEQTTADYLATTPDALRPAALQFAVFPLLIAFAAAIMIFWYLESIADPFYFCLVNSSMVVDNQILMSFLGGIFPTHQCHFSIFSPFRKSLPSFASRVAFQLRPDMTVTPVNSAIEELWPLCIIECTDINLSLILSFSDSVTN